MISVSYALAEVTCPLDSKGNYSRLSRLLPNEVCSYSCTHLKYSGDHLFPQSTVLAVFGPNKISCWAELELLITLLLEPLNLTSYPLSVPLSKIKSKE